MFALNNTCYLLWHAFSVALFAVLHTATVTAVIVVLRMARVATSMVNMVTVPMVALF